MHPPPPHPLPPPSIPYYSLNTHFLSATMKVQVLVMVAVLLVAVTGVRGRPSDSRIPTNTYHELPAAYDYKYGVVDEETGNDFGHEETRNDEATNGRYYVLLPDGRVQTVLYTVTDEGGFVADVSYAR